ncbi:protein DBF4 homolog B [Discoglossus pictus]
MAASQPKLPGHGVRALLDRTKHPGCWALNIIIEGSTFYLDLPPNKYSQQIATSIAKLGGVVESFLSRDVTYLVTDGKKEAGPAAEGHTGASEAKENRPSQAVRRKETTPYSRGKQLLNKVVNKQIAPCTRGQQLLNKVKQDCSRAVFCAHTWGVRIIQLDDLLPYIKRGFSLQKRVTQGVSASPSAQCLKVFLLKKPFLKIEDQSRKFRPIKYTFSSFPEFIFMPPDKNLFYMNPLPSAPSKEKEPCEEQEEESHKQRAKQSGYCECCRGMYSNFSEHLVSEKHLRFAQDTLNYIIVDEIAALLTHDFMELAIGFGTSSGAEPDTQSGQVITVEPCAPYLDVSAEKVEGPNCPKNTAGCDDAKDSILQVMDVSGQPCTQLQVVMKEEVRGDSCNAGVVVEVKEEFSHGAEEDKPESMAVCDTICQALPGTTGPVDESLLVENLGLVSRVLPLEDFLDLGPAQLMQQVPCLEVSALPMEDVTYNLPWKSEQCPQNGTRPHQELCTNVVGNLDKQLPLVRAVDGWLPLGHPINNLHNVPKPQTEPLSSGQQRLMLANMPNEIRLEVGNNNDLGLAHWYHPFQHPLTVTHTQPSLPLGMPPWPMHGISPIQPTAFQLPNCPSEGGPAPLAPYAVSANGGCQTKKRKYCGSQNNQPAKRHLGTRREHVPVSPWLFCGLSNYRHQSTPPVLADWGRWDYSRVMSAQSSPLSMSRLPLRGFSSTSEWDAHLPLFQQENLRYVQDYKDLQLAQVSHNDSWYGAQLCSVLDRGPTNKPNSGPFGRDTDADPLTYTR